MLTYIYIFVDDLKCVEIHFIYNLYRKVYYFNAELAE